MVEGHVWSSHDDQRPVRNGGGQACVPRSTQVAEMPDSSGRVLRVAASGKAKQPYCFEVNDGELFAFAGLWDRWKDAGGQWIKSCSILTTTPNAVTSSVHDRMPVILCADSYDLWLDPGMTNVEAVSEMLKPCDAGTMRCYPVSTRVNHVVNDDAECSIPVKPAQVQGALF